MENPVNIEQHCKPLCSGTLFKTSMPGNTLRRLIISLALFSSLTAHFAWAGLDEGRQAYEKGEYAKALKELRPLAEKGQSKAQTILGFLYFQGLGMPENHAEGLKWLRPAAEHGSAEAQFALGVIYAGGKAVPQNNAEAYKWFYLASAQGSEMAKRYMASSAKNLTPEQIAKAQDTTKAGAKKHEVTMHARAYRPQSKTVTAIADQKELEKLRPSLEASIKPPTTRQRKNSTSDLRECLNLPSNEAIAKCAG